MKRKEKEAELLTQFENSEIEVYINASKEYGLVRNKILEMKKNIDWVLYEKGLQLGVELNDSILLKELFDTKIYHLISPGSDKRVNLKAAESKENKFQEVYDTKKIAKLKELLGADGGKTITELNEAGKAKRNSYILDTTMGNFLGLDAEDRWLPPVPEVFLEELNGLNIRPGPDTCGDEGIQFRFNSVSMDKKLQAKCGSGEYMPPKGLEELFESIKDRTLSCLFCS